MFLLHVDVSFSLSPYFPFSLQSIKKINTIVFFHGMDTLFLFSQMGYKSVKLGNLRRV